jgi:hypothetical protein
VGDWVMATPYEPAERDFMFSAELDANDDFRAAVFTAAHGYYRQAMGTLRGGLEMLAIAAGFAVRGDWGQYERWQGGEFDPKFGNAIDFLSADAKLQAIDLEIGSGGIFGRRPVGVLKRLYDELCAFVHPQANSTNGAIWNSNGQIWVPDALSRFACDCKDTVAMGYLLLAIGWADYEISEKAWQLFDRPEGIWQPIPVDTLKKHFQHRK